MIWRCGTRAALMFLALGLLVVQRASWGALDVASDVNYLRRLRRTVAEADLIVEGKLRITANSRIRPWKYSTEEQEGYYRQVLAKNGYHTHWAPVPDGELAGQVSVAARLKGDGGRSGEIRVYFPRHTYFVPPRGVLGLQFDGDGLLRSDIEDRPFIWLLKAEGDSYRPVGHDPNFYALPARASRLTMSLAKGESDVALRKEALRLLTSAAEEDIVLGTRILNELLTPATQAAEEMSGTTGSPAPPSGSRWLLPLGTGLAALLLGFAAAALLFRRRGRQRIGEKA